ncbi:bifunctional phosphatase PAP2/diacylglycerol kinase family protein [Propionibacteriaceae bacterium Y1923]|uniref:bifunctional phosphatase PAP2/diacylglycerol kinase family protein n=1 Tax=Aestuariimicrobium sp. Y1814 TaxID=3418742 RepID=UPI003C1879C7
MQRSRRVSKFAVGGLVGSIVAFALWTWLVHSNSLLDDFDRAIRPPLLGGAWLEVNRAVAVVTLPVVGMLLCCLALFWALRRRLRNLAFALFLAPAVAWSLSAALSVVIARARPPLRYDPSFTLRGPGYPSQDLAVITAVALMAVVVATVTRAHFRTLRSLRFWMVLLVAVMAVNRWLVGAAWASDLVGGILLGVAATSAAGTISGLVREPVWFTLRRARDTAAASPGRACAVIYNPVKVGDEATFRRRVEHECATRGWDAPQFLTTTVDDPGYAMTTEAKALRPDLVLVAGGDGTVRVVCSELAHSEIPLGIIAAGTANLLARNLGIPLDESEALETAFEGIATPTDLVKVTIDGDRRHAEHFAVMGGLGIDGKVMAQTNAELKRVVKSVAYFVAVAQNLNTPPVQATVTLDGKLVNDNPATLMLVGNVAEVQAGLAMFPHGTPFDGELDLIVTSPRGFGQWVRWGLKLLRKQVSHSVTEMQGRKVEIKVGEPMPYQFDGDTLGMASSFVAEVVPGAVTIMTRPYKVSNQARALR